MGPDKVPAKREVVVVLGTVLFAFLNLAAVGPPGRERAKRVVCLSNLKQLAHAWLMYARDNDGKIVNGATGWSYQNMPWGDHTGELAWVHESAVGRKAGIKGIQNGALWPYLKDARIYRCPLGLPEQALTYSVVFSMNAVLYVQEFKSSPVDQDWHGKYIKKMDEIGNPSLRLVFIDEGTLTPDAFAAHYSRQWWWDLPPVQHNDGGTLSFADGHAEHWRWKSPETIAIGRSGAYGQGIHTCGSCEACEDLHKLQRAIWGKLGYEPSCETKDQEARE